MPLADAVGATFVIRICTLWFAVAIGAYVLLKYRRYFEWEPDDASGVLDEGGGQRYGERDEFCAV